jgi:hypothetical protein
VRVIVRLLRIFSHVSQEVDRIRQQCARACLASSSKGLRGLEVRHQLVLGRGLQWEIGGFLASGCGQSSSLRAGTDGSYAGGRLFVFGCGLRFALRLFSACDPRRSNLHQYRFVLFRCSLRQTAAFCRILPEAVSVTVHDTFHLLGVFQCSELFGCVPKCSELQTGNSKDRSGSNQLR